jgi:hypothetical protein
MNRVNKNCTCELHPVLQPCFPTKGPYAQNVLNFWGTCLWFAAALFVWFVAHACKHFAFVTLGLLCVFAACVLLLLERFLFAKPTTGLWRVRP